MIGEDLEHIIKKIEVWSSKKSVTMSWSHSLQKHAWSPRLPSVIQNAYVCAFS